MIEVLLVVSALLVFVVKRDAIRRYASHEPKALRLVDQRQLTDGRESDAAVRRVIAEQERRSRELAARMIPLAKQVEELRRRVQAPADVRMRWRRGLESLLACAATSPEMTATCRHGETLTLQEIRVAIADGDWCACCRKVEDPPWSRPVPMPLPGPGERRSG